MAKTGWKRGLGTSKKEQGIVTPKAPQNQTAKQRWLKRGDSLWNHPRIVEAVLGKQYWDLKIFLCFPVLEKYIRSRYIKENNKRRKVLWRW